MNPSDTDASITDPVTLQEKQELDVDLGADICRTGPASASSGNASNTIMFYSLAGSRPRPSMTLYMWGKHHPGSEV